PVPPEFPVAATSASSGQRRSRSNASTWCSTWAVISTEWIKVRWQQRIGERRLPRLRRESSANTRPKGADQRNYPAGKSDMISSTFIKLLREFFVPGARHELRIGAEADNRVR